MKENVSGTDEKIRVIIGMAIIAAAIYFHSWWGVLALVPLTTAAFNYCPAYSV
jgi:hypothetical protein